jgi:hypothetical protein
VKVPCSIGVTTHHDCRRLLHSNIRFCNN